MGGAEKTAVTPTGESSYTDRKGITHKVIHSVVGTQQGRRELEQKIVDDLYAVFRPNR